MLATRISFMNEVANVCEAVGADVDQVRKAVGVRSADRPVVPVPRRRLRRQLLPEGREGDAAVRRAIKDYDFKILHAVEAVNERQKMRLLDKMQTHFGDR